MPVCVRLLTVKHLEINGIPRTFHPGDWVEIGRQTATTWLAAGDAEVPDAAAAGIMPPLGEVGILEWGAPATDAPGSQLGQSIRAALEFLPGGGPHCPWPKTIIWQPSLPLRGELIPAALGILDVWEIAYPLFDYRTLARDLGGEEERAATKAIIRDLRVPVPDTRLVFVRKTATTVALLEDWQLDMANGSNEQLALLRAIYRHKPYQLPLPVTWAGNMAWERD